MRPLLSLSERLLARLAINLEDLMFQWADFEAAAPELAAQGRELIESFRFVLAGTIRRDGTPRISPVEAHIVGGHLMLVMISGTRKAGDLLRDPRILLNSPVKALREITAVAIKAASGWQPPQGWHFFSIDIEDAAFIAWKAGEMQMARWNRDRGLDHVTRRTAVLDEPGQ